MRRMQELKQRYREALPERIAALEAERASLPAAPEEARIRIRRIAHALRGSGASYGFPEVTEAAAALEDAPEEALEERLAELLRVARTVAAGAGGPRVLVVDDDPEMQLLLRAVLARASAEVEVAESAAAAVARAGARPFALVLLDLVLPDADGRSVLRAIRQAGPNARTPVLVLSARAAGAVRAECTGLGADAVIEKPFDPESLAAEIARILGAAAPAPPSAR